MSESFRWSSSLGVSVAIFLAISALWIMIGVLSMVLVSRWSGVRYLFVSNSADTAYFGEAPERLLEEDPALSKLRKLLLEVMAGFLVMAGVLFGAIAWFALRQAQPWALYALGTGGAAAIAFWAIALSPYVRQGVRLTLGDVPPFMWVPALLLVPALILGWIGLR